MSNYHSGEVFICEIDPERPYTSISDDAAEELDEFVDSIDEDQRLVTKIDGERMVVQKLYD